MLPYVTLVLLTRDIGPLPSVWSLSLQFETVEVGWHIAHFVSAPVGDELIRGGVVVQRGRVDGDWLSEGNKPHPTLLWLH